MWLYVFRHMSHVFCQKAGKRKTCTLLLLSNLEIKILLTNLIQATSTPSLGLPHLNLANSSPSLGLPHLNLTNSSPSLGLPN